MRAWAGDSLSAMQLRVGDAGPAQAEAEALDAGLGKGVDLLVEEGNDQSLTLEVAFEISIIQMPESGIKL